MTAICNESTYSFGQSAPLRARNTTTPLDSARRLAGRMLECARPNHESMLGYAMACSEWRMHGFHKNTGPLFDEVNALRAAWWGDGLASDRGMLSLENVTLALQATSPT